MQIAFEQFVVGGDQVSTFVDVANDVLSRLPDFRFQRQRSELPEEVIGQCAGLGQEVFERRRFVHFVVVRGTEAGIEIFLEIGAKVHFLKGIGLLALGVGDDLFGRPFALRLLAGDVVEEGNVFFQFLKYRILDDFGVDHLPQLELVQGKHTDHLHEARCEYLPLRDLQAQSWLKQCHRGRRSIPE